MTAVAAQVQVLDLPSDGRVTDPDTWYQWPDRMVGTARQRRALFAAEAREDPHRGLYAFESRPEPEPVEPEPVELEGPHPVSPTRYPLPDAQPDSRTQFGVMAGPPSLLPDDAGMVELFTAARDRRATLVRTPDASFATITTTTSGRNTQLLGVTPRFGPRRIAELGGIATEEVSWGASSAFPILGAGTPPAVTAEGVAKPEYAAITAGVATPQTIALWTDITNQVLSLANFELKLRNKLARLLATGENEILRAKVAGTAGVVTQTFVAGDQSVQILRSAAIIEAALNERPNLFLYNPADVLAIFGTSVANAAPQEVAQLSVQLFGMLSLPMASQPAGFVTMGAWQAGSRLVVGLRPQYLTNPYSAMKTNVTTVMLEEAVDLAVEEPEAFRIVDIVTP